MSKTKNDSSQDCLEPIGKHIKFQRMRQQITAIDFAARIGRTTQSLSRLENGHSDITISQLYDIADKLGVCVKSLIPFDSEKPWVSYQAYEHQDHDGMGDDGPKLQ